MASIYFRCRKCGRTIETAQDPVALVTPRTCYGCGKYGTYRPTEPPRCRSTD